MSGTRPIPSEWLHSYHGNLTGRQVVPPWEPSMSGPAESTVITTTTATTTTNNNNNNSSIMANAHLNAEGRVGKSNKRRSRASRKGPTTLFNTDTTNFRAMVQQFTGAPTTPFSSGSMAGAPITNFGIGLVGGHGPYQGMMVPPSQPHPSLQQHHQRQQQQLLALQGGGGSLFSLGNNRPTSNMEISDAFLESISSYEGQTSNDNNNNNGFNFIREDRFRNQY